MRNACFILLFCNFFVNYYFIQLSWGNRLLFDLHAVGYATLQVIPHVHSPSKICETFKTLIYSHKTMPKLYTFNLIYNLMFSLSLNWFLTSFFLGGGGQTFWKIIYKLVCTSSVQICISWYIHKYMISLDFFWYSLSNLCNKNKSIKKLFWYH